MQREIEFLGDDSKDHPPSDEGRFFLQMFSQFFLGHPHVMPKWTHKKKVKRPCQRHRPSLLHNQKLKTPSHPRQRHLLSQLHNRKVQLLSSTGKTISMSLLATYTLGAGWSMGSKYPRAMMSYSWLGFGKGRCFHLLFWEMWKRIEFWPQVVFLLFQDHILRK